MTAARTYWVAVSSDATMEAGGGGEAGLQTDWTRRLNRPPYAARCWQLIICTPARWNSAASLIVSYDPHAYTQQAAMLATLSPSHHRETDLSQKHSVSLRDCGGGRGRAACSKQQRLKWCLLSRRQSQSYLMTLTSFANIICCMQATGHH